MKIAVIGTGIAGLTSAYLLGTNHDITIFEKNKIGGHAQTVKVDDLYTDAGFYIFNKRYYKNLNALIKLLGLEYIQFIVSFQIISMRQRNRYLCMPVYKDLIGVLTNFPIFIRIKYILDSIAKVEDDKMLMRDLLELYDNDILNDIIFPLLSVPWSSDTKAILDFPVVIISSWLRTSGISDPFTYWQKMKYGSRSLRMGIIYL